MTSISSRPQVPPSPLCGLRRPAIATRGAVMPLASNAREMELSRLDDALLAHVARDVLQGHVRGAAR